MLLLIIIKTEFILRNFGYSILIMGYAGSMNDWEPMFLHNLPENHTVIVFDSRRIGNTELDLKTSQ
jgi:hypothetical protein